MKDSLQLLIYSNFNPTVFCSQRSRPGKATESSFGHMYKANHQGEIISHELLMPSGAKKQLLVAAGRRVAHRGGEGRSYPITSEKMKSCIQFCL